VTKFIGLYGYHGAGKSSVAAILNEKFPTYFTVRHLADALKDEAEEFYGLPKEIFYSVTKKDKRLSLPVAPTDRTSAAICDAIGASDYFTPRDLLIAYGAFRRFYKEDYWIQKVMNANYGDKIVLIPDVRFINEVTEIKGRKGLLIQVIKEGNDCKRTDDSEVQQKNFNPDLVIKAPEGMQLLKKEVDRNTIQLLDMINEI
jgi:hypothetical protein